MEIDVPDVIEEAVTIAESLAMARRWCPEMTIGQVEIEGDSICLRPQSET